jgi:hypothetical protein
MTFNRHSPSGRYLELLEQYRNLHERGEPLLGLGAEKTFSGQSLMPHVGRIKALLDRTDARTVLDYGCGKGQQYGPIELRAADGVVYPSVLDYWDVDCVHCYDPAYVPYSELPKETFDAVVCTDVLEHCPEDDIGWILDELFGYARKFVYANVACFPAKKHLPNGENAHCTVRPASWWQALLAQAAARRPGVLWEVWVQTIEEAPSGSRLREQCLSGQAAANEAVVGVPRS